MNEITQVSDNQYMIDLQMVRETDVNYNQLKVVKCGGDTFTMSQQQTINLDARIHELEEKNTKLMAFIEELKQMNSMFHDLQEKSPALIRNVRTSLKRM